MGRVRDVMDKQKEAIDCLNYLLDLESGLSESDMKWIDIYSKVTGRPFSKKEIKIIFEIYDRRS